MGVRDQCAQTLSPQVSGARAVALGVALAHLEHLAAGELEVVDGVAAEVRQLLDRAARAVVSVPSRLAGATGWIFSGRSATVTAMPSVPVMPWPT